MDKYTELAQKTVESYVKKGKIIEPPQNLPNEMLKKKAGIFVSIHEKNGALRGCIGTFLSTKENIAKEIVSNAVSSSHRDNRFLPIKKRELKNLKYSVDVLTEPVLIKDLSELNPKKFGVIVKSGYKTGLLLPDLEGINLSTDQIFIACQKAGIDQSKEKIEIYKFEVERHK